MYAIRSYYGRSGAQRDADDAEFPAVMACDQQGDAKFVLHPGYQRKNGLAAAVVETGKRLVHEQHMA